MQRECMPLPGPPEEKELAVPSSILSTLYISILSDLYSHPGKAIPNSKKVGSSDNMRWTPPLY